MTPKSWDTWAERFRARGYQVIVPGWPGIDDRSPEDVREHPESLKGIGLKEIADHYERIIRALPRKPIIMGHSFGGLITQMLADRGLGVAYVGVEPGQPAGITTLPLSTVWTSTPILSNPFGKNGAKPISKSHFHFTFGNDLPAPSPTRSGRSRPSTPTTGSSSRASRARSTRRAASRTSTTTAPTARRCSS
ncbi:alpha/beta hydrolase [Agromyces protaetiae]|uniref:alpha/beta hydrolase n=1 Tax=Agromyces protaetiae TaxID=2509455 RepID=UPI001FB70B54|nr:alpha/beta fold hydrolase [Agromyces protaetiae]